MTEPRAKSEAPSALTCLAVREREVLQLMADGLASKEIASRLDISVNTVRVYRERIYSKLRVNGLAQAVRLVTEGVNRG